MSYEFASTIYYIIAAYLVVSFVLELLLVPASGFVGRIVRRQYRRNLFY